MKGFVSFYRILKLVVIWLREYRVIVRFCKDIYVILLFECKLESLDLIMLGGEISINK